MKFEFHLTIFAIVLNNIHSAPYGLIRRQQEGYDSIVVYAVPSPPAASAPVYVPYDTPTTFCRHGIRSTPHHNHRQTHNYQQVVGETVRNRNNSPYSSQDNEKTARHQTPYYNSVRDLFESSHHRRNYYDRENSPVSQARSPNYLISVK